MNPDETCAWLRRQLPTEDWLYRVDPRCWAVTNVLGNIYNLVNRELPGLGVRPLPMGRGMKNGVALYLRNDFATQDFDELTRLVLAAHEHACRVSVSAASLWVSLRNPYDFESGYATVLEDYEAVQSLTDSEPALYAGCQECQMSLVRPGPDDTWQHRDEDSDEHPGHDPVPSPVELYPLSGMLDVMIHPRMPWGEGESTWRTTTDHPTLAMLAERVDRARGVRKTTRTQTLLGRV